MLAPAQLFARLRQPQALGAVALVGTDAYWRDQCRKKLVETFVPEGAREWAVARFSAADVPLEHILRQAVTHPMLSPRQVIFVEELEALEKRGQQARQEAGELLARYLENPAPFTLLVFEAESLDQRTRLAKLLGQKALVVELAAPSESAAELPAEMARKRGVEIDRDAAEFLSELVAGQAARLETEIEKLATYAGERRRITARDVAALVVPTGDYSVWELAKILGAGERSKALEFLDGLLRAGEAAPQIVGALAWTYRKLLEAQELPAHASGWDAARRLGMRLETAEAALRRARKIPRESLRAGLVALAEADNRLKSGKVDDRAVMEFLVARLTRPPCARSSAAP
jgi:DNA polymerase-3 subunit delta